MGRPRKFKNAKALEKAWLEYKEYCDKKTVLVHDFSQKNSKFVSAEVNKKVTYTIEGFCAYIGIARASFYENYANNPEFADTVTRAREECEIDAREKFELGVIPSQLAGLWMANYGYTTKFDNNVLGSVPVVISGDDELED